MGYFCCDKPFISKECRNVITHKSSQHQSRAFQDVGKNKPQKVHISKNFLLLCKTFEKNDVAGVPNIR